MRKSLVKSLIGGAALAFGLNAVAADITGAGATFPAPVYAKWAEAYKAATGAALNYQAVGSGGGIKQITAKTVDFGASDDPLSVDALNKEGLVVRGLLQRRTMGLAVAVVLMLLLGQVLTVHQLLAETEALEQHQQSRDRL